MYVLASSFNESTQKLKIHTSQEDIREEKHREQNHLSVMRSDKELMKMRAI